MTGRSGLPAGRPLWTLCGPTPGALLGAFLLGVPIGPELTALQRVLHLTYPGSLGLLAVYLVPAVLTTPVGVLVGRRWPTAVGTPAVLFMIVGLASTVAASTAAMVVLGRGVTGLGAGAVCGVAAGLSTQVVRYRTATQWVLLGAGLLALLAGPVVAALLDGALGWRWVFLLALPAAVVGLVAIVAIGIVTLVLRVAARNPVSPRGSTVVGVVGPSGQARSGPGAT